MRSTTSYPINRLVRACVLGLGLVARKRQDVEDARGDDASHDFTQELWIASPDARRAMSISFLLVLGLGAVLLCGPSSSDRCVRSFHPFHPPAPPALVRLLQGTAMDGQHSRVCSRCSEEALRLGCILSYTSRAGRELRRAIPTAAVSSANSCVTRSSVEVDDDVLQVEHGAGRC